MAPDQDQDQDRDGAVRTMLVEQVTQPTPAPLFPPERFRTGLVTAVVLVAIVALSVVAVRFGAHPSAPAVGGMTPSASALPTPTALPAGKLLGRFASDVGPNQTHTIHPDGLAIATAFECTGAGDYTVSIAHDSEESESGTPTHPGSCDGGSSGSSNKGTAGATTVKISTAKDMRWTLTIVGIPETYVTPRAIPTPTDSAGTAVPYCTADDLSARFAAGSLPKGVTAVFGGNLVFTNTSGTTCALAGYPEVRFLDGTTPLGTNTMNHIDERSSTADGLRAVIVAPGAHAYSAIDWYLPGENAKEEGACVARTVSSVQVDLAYDLSSPGQTGTLTAPIGTATACMNGAHGALGKYGQISSTVFVDYAATGRD